MGRLVVLGSIHAQKFTRKNAKTSFTTGSSAIWEIVAATQDPAATKASKRHRTQCDEHLAAAELILLSAPLYSSAYPAGHVPFLRGKLNNSTVCE